MTPSHTSFARTWTIPIALAVLTCFGLLAALLGTGAWHWASWLCLAIPLITGLAYWRWPRKSR